MLEILFQTLRSETLYFFKECNYYQTLSDSENREKQKIETDCCKTKKKDYLKRNTS